MLKKTVEFTLLLLLIVAIFYLGYTSQLKLLINPKYFIFIYLSLIILFIFLSVVLFTPVKSNQKIGVNRSYFLILGIIILMLFTSYGKYQEQVSDLKGINLGDDIAYKNDIQEIPKKEKIAKENVLDKKTDDNPLFLGNLIEINDENFLDGVDDIYRNMKFYENKTVTIKGFVYKAEGLNANQFIMARMVMVCCAADTSIYGLLCDSSSVNYQFSEDGWFEIEGKIGSQNLTVGSNTSIHPIINVINYRSIAQPEDPYIYPSLYF